MIETNNLNLSEFLKNKSVDVVSNNISSIITPVSDSPIKPINNIMLNGTDTFDKLTNLLESINKLLNSPLLSQFTSKGIERKNNLIENKEIQQMPEGYLPINNNIQIKQDNKKEKAVLLFEALYKTIEELKKMNEERTIKSIYEEISQEEIKEELINKIEVFL